MDIDNDGLLSAYELEYLYSEQLTRMENLAAEIVTFEDILCQMLDMVKPHDNTAVLVSDLRRCKQADVFINTFTNLNKFLSYETRDPFMVFQENQGNTLRFCHLTSMIQGGLTYVCVCVCLCRSEWQRFARVEYDRMAQEDESVEDGDFQQHWDAAGGLGDRELSFWKVTQHLSIFPYF